MLDIGIIKMEKRGSKFSVLKKFFKLLEEGQFQSDRTTAVE